MASSQGMYTCHADLLSLHADNPTAIEHTLRTVFRRCVVCPDETPSCPTCNDGEYCSQLLSSCTQCASAVCVKMDGSPGSTKKPTSTNVGAIVGDVIGGIAVLLIITFLVWKFYYKGKRRQFDEADQWSQMDVEQEKGQADFTMRRDARASTHTVASMASTVLTRASNIIQIAYIPGVTNRSGAPSPGTLVPPVPPIPSAHSGATSPYTMGGEQHFFVPGDLRDSTYSGLSAGRSSISPSLARSSVATTIYRNNAVISPLPAQTIVRGKAAVVSVKSNSTGSPTDTPGIETPPVPSINYDQLEKDGKSSGGGFKIQMPHSSDKPGISPQGSVKSVQIGKPKALTIKKGKASNTSLASTVSKAAAGNASPESKEKSEAPERIPITMRPLTEVSIADSAASSGTEQFKSHMDDDSSDDEGDDSASSRRQSKASGRNSNVTEIQDTPGVAQSPFADSNRSDNLETVVEESTKPAAPGSPGHGRATSPFGDEHALN